MKRDGLYERIVNNESTERGPECKPLFCHNFTKIILIHFEFSEKKLKYECNMDQELTSQALGELAGSRWSL